VADAATNQLPTYTGHGTVRTIVTWTENECLSFTHNQSPDGSPRFDVVCDPEGQNATFDFKAVPGTIVGIDPIMKTPGQVVACVTYDVETGHDLVRESGYVGDGTDVNCTVRLN
jgi:hypothetical protein